MRMQTVAGRLRPSAENIKQNVGISAEIDVTPVGKVDRSAGKAVRIIDRRND